MKRYAILTVVLALNAAAHAWQPAPDSMLTEWGEKLTAATAWPEYPRPAFARGEWHNLNGLWEYQVTPQSQTAAPADWAGDILVPFAIESALSGVKKRITPDDALWYRRSFEAPTLREGRRLLLNFEAVDYHSTVWVNDTQVGTHLGGNLPFSFDITDALKPGGNILTVRATDATDAAGAYQLHGKQVREPRGIWYTPVSGIWQTVWLETVPAVHVTSAKITPSTSGKGHLWNPNARNWGYGGLPKDKDEWLERYKTSIAKLAELKKQGIAAGIYTQTTDVEGEVNGLITYDRRVRKLEPAALAAIHRANGIPDDAGDGTSTAQPDPGSLNIPKVRAAPVQPAMSRAEIEAGLKSHDRALYIKQGWIRDPYIVLGPDDFYYLTGTTINDNDPREQTDPYNVGLGNESAVGNTVRVWKSKDLIDWQYLGVIFALNQDSVHQQPGDRVWAPEVHWIPEMKRWALVHCPKQKSNLAISAGPELKGPWTHPMGPGFAGHHDPSIFRDGDTWWVLSENTHVQPLAADFTKFNGPQTRIDPAGSRTNSQGRVKSVIGHEGATMIKVGGKYVHLGTAWSTDEGRKGSYNLYYCTSDKITGPYGPRKFAGRFLGHGTPFQTRGGKWWCTAFFNANVPPLSRDGIETRDLSQDAQTINQRGTTIVPLEVEIEPDGDVYIRAKDPAYATPGPDEVQEF